MSDTGSTGASGQTGASSEPGSKDTTCASSEPGSTPPGATFTQEQVDRFIARERGKLSDYDTIKTKLADLEAKDKTDLERAQSAAKDAETRATEALSQRNRMLARAAVTSAAVRAGALDPNVVVALLADSVTVNESGDIDGDVEKLVTSLLEDKPFLKNGSGPVHGSADGGAHGRSSASASTPSATMDTLFRNAH